MRYGYKQQYEVDAIADYAEIVKLLANAHPESAALQAYLSKVKLTAIMLLASEMREIGVSDIVRDRLDDCRDCERQEGIRPCMSEGLYGKCKYNSSEYRAMAVIKHFGKSAFGLLEPYLPSNTKEGI